MAFCWIKLYGFPFNPGIWLCFFLHDLGYIGCDDMDGEEGRLHPWWAYNFLSLFSHKLAEFCVFHSRFMVDWNNKNFDTKVVISKLGIADKLAVIYTPIWMYRKEELKEYVDKEDLDLHTIALWNVVDKAIDYKYKITIWKEHVNKKCINFVNEWKDRAYDIQQYKT